VLPHLEAEEDKRPMAVVSLHMGAVNLLTVAAVAAADSQLTGAVMTIIVAAVTTTMTMDITTMTPRPPR
jgi:hypothetical protein